MILLDFWNVRSPKDILSTSLRGADAFPSQKNLQPAGMRQGAASALGRLATFLGGDPGCTLSWRTLGC